MGRHGIPMFCKSKINHSKTGYAGQTIVETEQHKSKTERPDAPRAEGTGDKLYMSKLFS